MKRIFLLILSFLCCGLVCQSQDLALNTGIGLIYPLERTYFNIDIINRITPTYELVLSNDISKIETNLSPKLKINVNRISTDIGFGWGHRFGGAEIDDHNFHTYTFGIYWNTNRYYIGSSMYWRSYQSHIGLHKGTLRFCFGIKLIK